MLGLIRIQTAEREEIIDITAQIQKAVLEAGSKAAAVHLFCQHTTCALTINESVDPAVKKDLQKFFQGIAPKFANWEHGEGNTDAHIRSSLLGVSLLIPIAAGRLALGSWQAIYLYEGDGPRQRTILYQFFG